MLKPSQKKSNYQVSRYLKGWYPPFYVWTINMNYFGLLRFRVLFYVCKECAFDVSTTLRFGTLFSFYDAIGFALDSKRNVLLSETLVM